MTIAALLLLLLSQAAPQENAAATPAAAVQPYVERQVLAGAVMLVANREKTLSVEAVGFADVAAKKPMAADTIFWIASQSKPITATAVMMLVDEGKIALDDPVEKYLPEFKGQLMIVEQGSLHTLLGKPLHPITIRNVLNHTSGMRFSSPLEKPTLDGLSLKDAVRSYALQPLQWEPDLKYQYSNAGINTAARVLEVVSGMPYEDFMQKRLFDPLGMKDTTFWPSEANEGRIAKTYKPGPNGMGFEEIKIVQLSYPLHDKHRYPMPAGGLFSTAADCARFCRMLLNGGELDGKRYLSEAALQEMTKRQTAASIKENYGLGFSTGNRFGHGGALATNMSVDPKQGLVYVWLVQHSGFPGDGGKAQGAFMKAAEQAFAK